MSIHFYRNGDTSKALFILHDDHYDHLQPIFSEFNKRTGIFIDPYGSTRLYPENLILIDNLLREKYKPATGYISDFSHFLEKIAKEDLLIIASGD